jgi:hypothetical protein
MTLSRAKPQTEDQSWHRFSGSGAMYRVAV